MRRFIPLVLCASALALYGQTPAVTYTQGPDSMPHPDTPKGTVTRFVLPPGKFYPGVPHNCQVYVPAQYDASKPTPFMIFLDGGGSANVNGNGVKAPVVFDNLIAKKDIPPMIAIFIDPGILPAVDPAAQRRFERIYEYDSINGRFGQFLIDELIPEVAKKYNLSMNPDDHAIQGASTGAVGAFMAAWNHPDYFHRVMSFIGTFVAMKGADTMLAVVRKSEPKPIRIIMQDGRNDHLQPDQPFGTFFAGSWPINNEVLYEDLRFAGYDVKYELGESGHDGRQTSVIFPDMMRWLWRDYGKPITAQLPAGYGKPGWDPRAQVFSTISIDKPWEQVGTAYKSAVSPAPDQQGNVYFADLASNVIYKSDAEGKVAVFKNNTAGARALHVGADGRLYASQPAQRRVVSWSPTGDMKVLAQNVTADDLAPTAKGAVYYVDSAHKTVGLIDAAGKSRVVFEGTEMLLPATLTLSPDQAMIAVGDAQNKFSWSLQIAADGSLINGEPFYRVDMPDISPYSGVSSITMDAEGQVFFATAVGIQLCEANGRAAAILSKPELGTVTGIAFGGKDLNWIYATEDGKLFRRPSLRKGIAAWVVSKPPNPPL
ncbi:MAG TPA: alpha/beta hydrolase-fold protein [Bryobacteraceae bacterium]|nr:alpha/beta hydrolase-fold protein [Bryobacteraceae bacterium]